MSNNFISAYHYEEIPEFYHYFLNTKYHGYSCTLWDGAKTLEESEEKKFDLIASKLQLKPQMNVLDIGCGWGGMIQYFRDKYQVNGEGITVSNNQANFGKNTCMNWQDLSDVPKYDAISSDEMLVHVKNRKEFYKKCYDNLLPDRYMLHKEAYFSNKKFDVNTVLGDANHAIFLGSGKYITYDEEISNYSIKGLEVKEIIDFPAEWYKKTCLIWQANALANNVRMKFINKDLYFDVRRMLKIYNRFFDLGVLEVKATLFYKHG